MHPDQSCMFELHLQVVVVGVVFGVFFLGVCVCVCVCVCCVVLCVSFSHVILYLNCFGRTVLYTSKEYHI